MVNQAASVVQKGPFVASNEQIHVYLKQALVQHHRIHDTMHHVGNKCQLALVMEVNDFVLLYFEE
jgi:hypothetical protein